MYEKAYRRVMRKLTRTKCAKAHIVIKARSTTPLQFRRFLRCELNRSKAGKTITGAFSHKPNYAIITIWQELVKQYDKHYYELYESGLASDEINAHDCFRSLHNKIKKSAKYIRG